MFRSFVRLLVANAVTNFKALLGIFRSNFQKEEEEEEGSRREINKINIIQNIVL